MAAEYPGMEVTPSYYPVSSARKAATNALSVAQYGAMAAVSFADFVAELLRTRLGVQARACAVWHSLGSQEPTTGTCKWHAIGEQIGGIVSPC